MDTILKPKIQDCYYRLNPRQATVVAIRAAKKYGKPGSPDMQIFKYMTQEYNKRYRCRQTGMEI